MKSFIIAAIFLATVPAFADDLDDHARICDSLARRTTSAPTPRPMDPTAATACASIWSTYKAREAKRVTDKDASDAQGLADFAAKLKSSPSQ